MKLNHIFAKNCSVKNNISTFLSTLFFCLLTTTILFAQQNGTGGQKMKINPINIFALIVGVSEYQFPDTYSPLEFADDDGRVFYNYLVNSNNGGAKQENIDTLFNEQATASAILTKLIDYKMKLKSGDVFYIYFSGHGDAIDSELSYLLPYDAPPSRGGKEKNHYLYGLTVLEIDDFKKIIRRMTLEGIKVVFIMDACRSNELAGGEEGKQEMFKKIMDEDAGELRMSSCSADQVSFESKQWGGGRGLFSYHLINGLIGMADTDVDGRVTVKEINRYVVDNVESDTKGEFTYIPEQTPQFGCSLEHCDYQVLNFVDPIQKAKLEKELKNRIKGNDLTAARGKGINLSSSLTALGKEKIYNEFIVRCKINNLTGAESAYDSYLTLTNDIVIPQNLKNEINSVYCNFLLNSVNKVINDYLDASLNYKVLTKEYFMKPYEDLVLYKKLSPAYEFNKNAVEANLLFLKGHSFYRSQKTGDLIYGKACIDSAILLNPNAAYLYNIKGIYHQALHQYNEAMSTFRQGHELAPNWIYPNINIGIIFSILKQSDSSLNYFKSALNLDPNYSRTYTFIAMEFSKRNEIDSAYFYINEGLSRDSNDPELLTLKGDLLIRIGENNQAINCYYTAYKVDSTYINAYVGLLKYHIENYVSQDSLEYYMTKIIMTDETNPYPYLFLAGYLSELKLYEVAKTYYNLSFVLDSLNTDMWNGLGDVYFQLNQSDTARALYDYSLLIDSNYALTYNRIGNLEYNENNLEGAIASYLKAYEINPWESVYTKGLGSFYYESKDYSNSLKYYLLYLNQYSVDASVYLDIVHCYIHLMDIDSAIKYFKIGIENNYWIETYNENNELKKLYIRSGESFYYENLKKDKELKILKKNKEFKEIMKSISTAL